MTERFTAAQVRAVQELVGLPRLNAGAVPARPSVPIDDLRQALGLAEHPWRQRLAPDLWLAGGSVLRWICRGIGMGDSSQADVDLYVPSLETFNAWSQALLERGFTFRCYRSRFPFCPLCGRSAERVEVVQTDFLPIDRLRCSNCGETGGEDARALSADRLVPLTEEHIAEHRILALELASPEGDMVHIGVVRMAPTLRKRILGHDFSVIQLGMDDKDVHFGPHAWTDILTDRNRLETPTHRFENLLRLKKYERYGFRPYGGTRVKVLFHRYVR